MRFVLGLFFAVAVWAHAPITPAPVGPLRVEGTRVLDATGAVSFLRGARLPSLDAATAPTLGVLRIRWNFNAVGIPVRAGELDRVAAAVGRAREAGLVVLLSAEGETASFWAACAGILRDVPEVVFVVSAPEVVEAIRGAGARQIVVGPGAGVNVLATGYVADWGADICAAVPSDGVFQKLYDYETGGVHWTVEASSLLQDLTAYEPTVFDAAWRCGQAGMGQTVLTWMTGDPIGFGYLRKEAVASAAGGPASPVAPGALLSLYIELMGPAVDTFGRLDGSGRLPVSLGGTEVFFDGVRVPILFAGQYQINVQAPYTLTPGRGVEVQVFYRGVPSNRVVLDVVPAAGELFHDIFSKNVLALNEDGARNAAGTPALAGSIVVLFGTGTGVTSAGGVAGVPAAAPHPVVMAPVSLRVDGLEAEILFAGEVPGFIGLTQINARLPRGVKPGAAPVVLRVGGRESQAAVVVAVL